MRNIVILTDTPARLRDFLIAHDILRLVPADDGGEHLIGVLPGMEWVKVDNHIQTSPGNSPGTPDNPNPGYIPPTYDNRVVFLVKFAHESESQKAEDFKNWILNNSAVVTAPAGWTLNGEPVGDVRKINGEQVWIAHDRPERFGVWQ